MEAVVFGAAGLVGLHALAYPFVAPALRRHCLPYVAANKQQLSMVSRICKEHKIKSVIDLGSGDGVVCVELAKSGVRSTGIELNPWLTLYARLSARAANVSRLTQFKTQNLFEADISKHDAVVLFVVPAMMEDLERKLQRELPSDDTLVISGRFPLKNWTPFEHVVHDTVASSGYNVNQLWLYRRPPLKEEKAL